jgi:hypothetical protein
MVLNPERVRQPPNPFRVWSQFNLCPRVLTPLEPWAEISERLRRNFKLMHHSFVAEGDTINLRAYTSVHVEKLSANLSTERPTL